VAQHVDGTFVLPPVSIAGVATMQAKPGETILMYGIGFGTVIRRLPLDSDLVRPAVPLI
jgi:hypothetical protein